MAPPSEQDEQPLGGIAPYRDVGRPPVPAQLEMVLGAEWVAASIARERVERWLRALGRPPAQIDDLVLAVSEAVSNSVEHGYRVPPDAIGNPGVVHVDGRLVIEADGFSRTEFTVRDQGRWREPVVGVSTRGHGILIMRSCADQLTIEHGPEGTTVVLLGRPVPPPLGSA